VVVDGISYPATGGIALAEGDHNVVVFAAPREGPKPTVDSTQSSSALVEQFKNERSFARQMEIAKAIAAKRDVGVLLPLADWLGHQDRHIRGNVAFIFASFGDPRGLQTITEILADRSVRPEGQGIPGGAGNGRYRFERQVASDRYYAAHLLGALRDSRGVALLVQVRAAPEHVAERGAHVLHRTAGPEDAGHLRLVHRGRRPPEIEDRAGRREPRRIVDGEHRELGGVDHAHVGAVEDAPQPEHADADLSLAHGRDASTGTEYDPEATL